MFRTRNREILLALIFCLVSLAPLSAAPVSWVDWTSGVSGSNGSAVGVMTFGGTTVNVNYSGEIAFIQTNGGTNYWNPSAPYISAQVDNAPSTPDIIALSQATPKTLTFSKPVTDLLFAVVSLNGNGYRFNQDFEVLSYGCGYWGCGTLYRKDVGGGYFELDGTGEPHGVIRFTGAVSSITWTSLSNEYWNGFTIGAFGVIVDTTPPEASITGGPSDGASLSTTNATFSWTGTDNLTAPSNLLFSYKMDDGAWSAYSSDTSHAFTSLIDGLHTFSVKAKDGQANESLPVTRTFTVDTTAPVISNLSAAPGITDCTITWTTNEPATSSVEYGMTTSYGSTTTPDTNLVTSHSVTITGLDLNTKYEFRVHTSDAASNESTSDGSFTTLIDPTTTRIWDAAADFSSTSNPNGAWSSGWTATVGSAFNLYPDIDFDSGTNWAWRDHAITVLGTPCLWKNGSSGAILGVVPSQLALHPGSSNQLSVLRWTASSHIDCLTETQFFSGDSGDTDGYILLNGSQFWYAPTTGVNPAFRQHISLNKGDVLDFAVGSKGSFYYDTTPINVKITGTIIPDLSQPDTTIVSGPAEASYQSSTSADFAWTGSDDQTAPESLLFSYKLDGGDWTDYSAVTSASFTGLAAGPHTFLVKAKDEAGNEDPTPAARSFGVDLAAPNTQIISGPGEGLTACGDSATFTFTGTDDTTPVGQLQYQWRIDGGAWSAVSISTSAVLNGLAQGTHTFEVSAIDVLTKVDASPAVRHFTTDVNPPVISNIASAPSRAQANISWTTDKPATSLVEYGADTSYGSSTPVNWSMVTSHNVSLNGLSPNTPYHYRVVSRDGCGHEVSSDDQTFTTLVDDGTPDTQIIAGPDEGGSSCSSSVHICWTGSDDVTSAGQLTYAWKLDSADWSTPNSETCHDFTGLAESAHTFSVRAYDGSGNVDATPAVRHFSVDLSGPTVSNVQASGQAAQATITWLTNKPATSQVQYGSTNAYGSATVVDSSLVTSHSVMVTGLDPESTYHFVVRSKDHCQREAVSTDKTFATTPDTNVPDTYITTSPPEGGKACDSTVQICWSGSDNATPAAQLQYSYKIDGGVWSDWASDVCHQYTGLTEGLHTFQVKSKDGSGNIDATPAVRNFLVDTTPPTVSYIVTAPRQSSVTVSWISSEPATSQVEYGEDTNYGSFSLLDSTMVTNHKLTVTGLAPEKLYHLRVHSKDGCREVVSDDQTFSTTPVVLPNLVGQSLGGPPAASSQQDIMVSWQVLNQSAGDAETGWVDSLYISEDETLDDGDALLGHFNRNQGLVGLFSYNVYQYVHVPIVAPGLHFLIMKIDSGNAITETNETDNIIVQPINITLLKQLVVAPDRIPLNVNPGVEVSGQIDISNLAPTPLTGITATVTGAASNISVQLTDVPSSLNGLNTARMSYKVIASDESTLQSSPRVQITTTEGVTDDINFDLNVIPRLPKLVANPGYLQTGMLRGKQTMVECEVSNIGGVPANNLQVLLPNVPWITLASPQNIGTLAPGEKAKVTLSLMPDTNLPLGPYNGSVVVQGSNGGVTIGFQFKAISDGLGDLKIFANDEFTYYASDTPHVAGATITLKDAVDGSVIFQDVTDSTGIYLKQGITEGHYVLEVKADKHGTYLSPVELVAGKVTEVTAFMPRQLVTYTWSVEPIQIEDKYKVTLEAVFETHVPAPVVTVDPPFQMVPVLEGKTTEIDFTVTNHGLIAALGTKIDFPDNDEYQIVPLIRDIGVLPAQSSIVVPVLIRARKDGPIPDLPNAATSTMAAERVAAREVAFLAKASTVKLASDDTSKPCSLEIEGKVLHYYVCDGNRWRQESIDLTLLYIGKEIWDVVSCGLDLAACASTAVDGIGVVKCPDAVRCLFKYTCQIISANLGTPCCFCKGVSSILGDTGEMGDALKCVSDLLPPRQPSPPSGGDGGGGIGIGLSGWWPQDFPFVVPWSFDIGGSCGGSPTPASQSLAKTAATKNVTVNDVGASAASDISKYGGREVRYKVKCY